VAAVSAALVLCAPAVAWAQSGEDELRLSLKVGVESDSNANREEGAAPTPDVLSRYFFVLDANHGIDAAQSVQTRVRSGGKLFRHVSRESTLLNQAEVRYTVRPLTSLAQDWLFVYGLGGIKDRTESESHRDYLRLEGTAGLGVTLGPVLLTGGGGYRAFAYKPDPALSSVGPGWELGARWSITDRYVLSGGASGQTRRYDATRFVLRDNGDVVQAIGAANLREDGSTALFGSFQYRGSFIIQVTGTWQDNASNSYGQSLARLGGVLSATVPLPADLALSGRFSVQQTTYSDEIFIDETFVVDEDNRNSFAATLEWGMTELIDLEVRYSLYTQEFGLASADYLRQLVFVGLGVEL